MDSFDLERNLQQKLEEIAKLVNSANNDLEKVFVLNNFWTKIHRFSDNMKNVEYYVAQKVVLDFFNRYSEHNDYLNLVQATGSSWKAFAFGIPLCYIKPNMKTVVFYSIDSLEEEFNRIIKDKEYLIEKDREKIRTLEKTFLSKTAFQLFVREIKLKSYISPSNIQVAKEKIKTKKQTIVEEKEGIEESKKNISRNLIKMILFINNITSDLYQKFTKEGWICELEDIVPYEYPSLHDSALSFEQKESLKGKGLFVNEYKSYVKKEKITFDSN